MHWQVVHTYTHTGTPLPVYENDEYKIFCGFNTQTDEVIEYRQPNMVCINTQKREFQIIDFAVSSDQRAGNIEK